MDKLYWAPSTAAFAPHAILEETGAPYQIEDLDWRGEQKHRQPEYLALNPSGTILTLETGDGEVITESAAITMAPQIKAPTHQHLLERWRLVDDQLPKAGAYILGDRYSAADIYLVMLATRFESREELFQACPGLKRCFELATARPAIHRTLKAHGEL